jgi:2-polyprenyl-3-methyl-5-hydroxy-6-metoxy-1,4-benzoquinol methylase
MYQVLEASFADVDRLFRFHIDGVYGAGFGIKGFDYPWLVTSYDWKKGIKVLDIGAAYSPLPIYLQNTYGCEVWAVDDFGITVGDDFWTRNRSPLEYINEHPEIKYVLERLGDPGKSSLPEGYFDVIYSTSTLEHVPSTHMLAVWSHMDKLLKPGGEMLHAVDLWFPSNEGALKLMCKLLFDLFRAFVPSGYKQNHDQATPLNYIRLVAKELGFKLDSTKKLDVLHMALSPNILVEGYQHGLNRILKDKIPDYHFKRCGSLMMHLKKSA